MAKAKPKKPVKKKEKRREIANWDTPFYDDKDKKVKIPFMVDGQEYDLILVSTDSVDAGEEIAEDFANAFAAWVDDYEQEPE